MNEYIKKISEAIDYIDGGWWGLMAAWAALTTIGFSALFAIIQYPGFPPSLSSVSPIFNGWLLPIGLFSALMSALTVLVIETVRRRHQSSRVGETRYFKKSFPHSQGAEFFAEIERLVPTAKEVTLVGAGINLLWQNDLIDILIRRAKAGEANVTVCMANPFGPHMESRYIEEEIKPIVGVVEGRQGMRNKVKRIVAKLEHAGAPTPITYRLFEHYPTLTTLIFDKDIYIYPYAFGVLGNTSPVFHFTNDGSETSNFLVENAKRIVAASIPGNDVVHAKNGNGYYSPTWIGAAVYIIPKPTTALYEFGSAILGYDIWGNRPSESPSPLLPNLSNYIGEANIYGFHATVADALFFAEEASIERVEAELKFLAEEFSPFTIKPTKFEDGFRDSNDIVLLASDDSGTVEALHHELVQRMYKMAISSNFLARKTKQSFPGSDNKRGRMMIKRYGAPHILSQHKLHFTFCSRTPKSDTDRAVVREQLETAAKTWNALAPIEISEICLVEKRNGDDKWKIRKSFSLTGPN